MKTTKNTAINAEVKMNVAEAVIALFNDMKHNFNADAKDLTITAAMNHGVHVQLLSNVTKALETLVEVVGEEENSNSDWTTFEDQALIQVVEVLGGLLGKMNTYGLFAKLVGRSQGTVQNRFSLLTKEVVSDKKAEVKKEEKVLPKSKREQAALVEQAVLNLFEKASLYFEGDIETLVKEIAEEAQGLVKETDLMNLYNDFVTIKMLQEERKKQVEAKGEEIEFDWVQVENHVLLNCLDVLSSTVLSNNRIFQLVGKILDRGANGGACYQHHKGLVEKEELEAQLRAEEEAKKQQIVSETVQPEIQPEEIVEEVVLEETKVLQPVETVHMNKDEHIEHDTPVSAKVPGLLESTTSIIDIAEKAGINPDILMNVIANGIEQACDKKQQEDAKLIAQNNKELVAEKRELTLQVQALEFQVEELTKVVKILNKQSENKDEKIHSLQAELYNFYQSSDAKAVVQLQQARKQYQLDLKDGIVQKKSV